MRRLAPVLAQVNQLAGVAASYSSESGGLVRVTLRRGANAAFVAAEVQRLLRAHVNDRTPVQLGPPDAAAQVTANQWRDAGRVSALAAIEEAKSEEPAAGRWLLLALACLAGALVLLGCWRRRCAAARSPGLASSGAGGRPS